MNFHTDAGPAGTKVKLKKLAISAGVALTLGAATLSANAGTATYAPDGLTQTSFIQGLYNLGSVGTSGVTLTSDLPNSGSFTDVYNFSLATGSQSIVGMTTWFDTTQLTAPNVNLSMTLSANGAPVSQATASSSIDFNNNLVSYGHKFSGLTSNTNYTLTVTGTGAEYLGQTYSFQMAAVAAVPEPETYAMLLAGLGLVGSIVRRRKTTV